MNGLSGYRNFFVTDGFKFDMISSFSVIVMLHVFWIFAQVIFSQFNEFLVFSLLKYLNPSLLENLLHLLGNFLFLLVLLVFKAFYYENVIIIRNKF